MRVLYSYARLTLAACLFLGGVALLFGPTTSALERESRWRQQQLVNVLVVEHAQWVTQRDEEAARTQAYVRLFGVVIGGLGLAGVVAEAVRQLRERPSP